MPIVAITEAIRTAMQILALVQSSQQSGVPISKADFDAAVQARDAALDRLDSDIAKAKAEGR